MFFCDSNPFRIFFNWEIEICGWYPHLVTSSYIKNDENMTNGYTMQQLRIVRILAYTTLTLLYIECLFMVELKLATRIQKQWSHPLIQMLSKNRALRNLYAKYYRFHRWVLSSFRILKTSHIETPFWCSKVILARWNELVTCALKIWPDFTLICYIVAKDCVMLLHWWSFVHFPA